jgi:hypothetical protein
MYLFGISFQLGGALPQTHLDSIQVEVVVANGRWFNLQDRSSLL